jgi:hypothetical protein
MVRLLIAVSLLCLSTYSCVPVEVASLDCQSTLDAFVVLTKDLEIPSNLLEKNAQKNGSEFDVNQYFTVLTHLSIEDGYVLDYVYFNDGFASWPVLYSRLSEDEPFKTHSEYEKKSEPGEYRYKFMDHVVAEGSKEGYLEWVLLATQGDQFYLGWHGGYVDKSVLCSHEDIGRVIQQANGYGAEFTSEQEQMAFDLDVEPSILLGADKAIVRIVTFTMWGGFFEESYVISTDIPHRLLEHTSKELVPYNCGVIF